MSRAAIDPLLAECEAQGIRLALDGDGGLNIDSPQGALTPDLLDRLKTHKAELLALLRPAPPDAELQTPKSAPNIPTIRLASGKTAIAGISGALLGNLKSKPAADPPEKPKPKCRRCGSAEYVDVPIHDGASTRRDCAGCGKYVRFIVWYNKILTDQNIRN
ncbi:MAG: hypothetical protein IT427_09305 [Pirellulales bacterium]|nr:hypothetical protein [Pirellulales bacterium]